MGNWVYSEDPSETEKLKDPTAFDEVVGVDIFDRSPLPACILRKGDKYGVYTLDHATGQGGAGTWYSPTSDAFPYDEVMFRPFPTEDLYGLLAFRIKDKWGIIKVADPVIDLEEGVYDVEYGGTKRRIVVPCRYKVLEDAELQLGASYEWENPFEKIKVVSQPNVVDIVDDVVDNMADPKVDHKTRKTSGIKYKRTPKKGLRVKYPNGDVLQLDNASDTLTEFIRRAGYQRVRALGIKVDHINLVSNTKDSKYASAQYEVVRGWYVNTHSNNKTKARQISKISKALKLDVIVEIV